jgi:hypothetical protein
MPKHLEEVPDSLEELINIFSALADKNASLRWSNFTSKCVQFKNPYSGVVYGIELEVFQDEVEEDWTVYVDGRILKHWWSSRENAYKHWIKLCVSP